MNGEQAEEDELSEPSLQALPLVDISIAGRRFRTQQKEVERFGAQLVQGLTQEMNGLSDGGQKSGLDQAAKFLLKGIAHLTLTAAAIPDRGQGAKVLKASLDLMFACADTASRIDRKLGSTDHRADDREKADADNRKKRKESIRRAWRQSQRKETQCRNRGILATTRTRTCN